MRFLRTNTKLFLAASLIASVVPAYAEAVQQCTPVVGTVRLDPDGSCGILGANPGYAYLGLNGVPNSCFTVRTSGRLAATGFAGLTAEPATSLVPGAGPASTPMVLNELGVAPAPIGGELVETRRVLSARTALSLTGGEIYTADMIITHGDAVVEQILITSGTGAYQGASGFLVITGSSIGRWAPFYGNVCLSR